MVENKFYSKSNIIKLKKTNMIYQLIIFVLLGILILSTILLINKGFLFIVINLVINYIITIVLYLIISVYYFPNLNLIKHLEKTIKSNETIITVAIINVSLDLITLNKNKFYEITISLNGQSFNYYIIENLVKCLDKQTLILKVNDRFITGIIGD